MDEYHRAAFRLLIALIATGVVQVPEVPHPPPAHPVVHRPDHSHAGHLLHPREPVEVTTTRPDDFLPFRQDIRWNWYEDDGDDAAFVATLESGVHQRNVALLTLTPNAPPPAAAAQV